MYAIAFLCLIFFVVDLSTESANAFIGHNHYSATTIQRRKFVSKLISLEGSAHAFNLARLRLRNSRSAAKDINFDSKDRAPSVRKGSEEEELYWIDKKGRNNFEVTFDNENETKRISTLRFKINGNPRPLQRHRTSRWHTYNPSVEYQKSFKGALKSLMIDFHRKRDNSPLFDEAEYLVVTIVFRMKRPKSHFVNNKPGIGRLKEKAPSQLSSIRTDVDNLTKFVLDSLNGLVYEDDRQITSIHATKLLDNEDLCRGSIEVYIRSIEADDIEKILKSSISIVDQNIKK